MGAKPYALYNENDDHAADWLENLIALGVIAPGIVDRRSIEDLRGDDLRGFRQVHLFAGIGVWSYSLRRAGISDDTAVWTGSCPCQPFSAAGKGAGMDDERHLWPAFLHLIGECRPDIVLGEQVASADGLGWLDLVQTDLEAASYAIGAVDTCSAGSGAPHIRQRLRFSAYDIRSAASRMDNLVSHRRLERRRNHREHDRFVAGTTSAFGRSADLPLIGRNFGSGLCCDEQGERGRSIFTNGSTVVELGNPDGARSPARIPETLEREERHAEINDHRGCRLFRPGSGESQPCRLAHDDDDQQRQGRDTGSTAREGFRSEPRGRDELNRMVDADRGRTGTPTGSDREDCAGTSREARPDDDTSLSLRTGSIGRLDEGVFVGRIERPGPTNGIWRDADWLFCRDDKWRAVEPGTFPLVDGSAFRLGSGSAFEGKSRQGMLKGYGNAIDAEATRVFVEACADFFADLDARRVKAELIGDLL